VVQLAGRAPSFQCTCPVGYKNSLCETPVSNVCDSSPCRNGGTCHLSSLHQYTCTCPRGWQGKHCNEPDNCASNPCRNGATCTSLRDRPNAYRCTCRQGYFGPDCNINVNECDAVTGKNPCKHGKCVDTYGGYK
jgi:Notch-like protein